MSGADPLIRGARSSTEQARPGLPGRCADCATDRSPQSAPSAYGATGRVLVDADGLLSGARLHRCTLPRRPDLLCASRSAWKRRRRASRRWSSAIAASPFTLRCPLRRGAPAALSAPAGRDGGGGGLRQLRGLSRRAARRGMALNSCLLVGHAALRLAVMGYERRAATAQRGAAMQALLARQLADGAAGSVARPRLSAERLRRRSRTARAGAHGAGARQAAGGAYP